MRVVWLCNVPLPQVSKELNQTVTPYGGWLVSVADELLKNNNQLLICFPMYTDVDVKGNIDNLFYYGYKANSHKQYQYNSNLDMKLQNCLINFSPEVIHVWGTEYPQSLSMVNAAFRAGYESTIVSIQGICTTYSEHYFNGVPEIVKKRFTLRDILRRDNLSIQYKKFCKQAEYELLTLKRAKHFIGRTEWDFACISQYATQGKYYFCNETLRSIFYQREWEYCRCEKYSIFVSQSSYPIKGFHLIVKALPEILRCFPNTNLYTTGLDPRDLPWYKLTSYQKYLVELIKELKLDDYVHFCGILDENQMCERYLKSNVFVSASSIENSPNSVGEAMLLGMPIVASYVGGTMDMLKDKEEGYLYQADAIYMLAYYIKSVFNNPEKSIEIGKKARKHALQTHNIEKNMSDLIRIYEEVAKKR